MNEGKQKRLRVAGEKLVLLFLSARINIRITFRYEHIKYYKISSFLAFWHYSNPVVNVCSTNNLDPSYNSVVLWLIYNFLIKNQGIIPSK